MKAFDYKEQIREYRAVLDQQLRGYVMLHPEEDLRDIAKAFGIGVGTLSQICAGGRSMGPRAIRKRQRLEAAILQTEKQLSNI